MASDASITRLGRRVRLGFVGGGLGSVIGNAHLVALRTDGKALQLAASNGAALPHAPAALTQLQLAVEAGYGEDDESAVAQYLRTR